MPAGLPGTAASVNATGNPNAGTLVLLDPLSGPKNSPLDARKFDYASGSPPGWHATNKVPIYLNDPLNVSTGQLQTGIGFGSPPVMPAGDASNPVRFESGNFTDDYIVGADKTDSSAATDSTYMYIGGGKSNAAGTPVPYTAGFGIAAAGGGGTLPVGGRDYGAGPAYLGAPIKTVTAAGAVAVNAAVETGWLNQSGGALVTGQSVFGVGTTAIVTPTDEEPTP